VIEQDFTRPGKLSSKAGLTRLGTCPGRTREKLRVTHSGKVPDSDSGKESGTISGKNPGKRPGKKSGRELLDREKTRVRRLGKTKMYKTRRLLCFG
jgi:hypothetical protein